jgi:hypothetical protein
VQILAEALVQWQTATTFTATFAQQFVFALIRGSGICHELCDTLGDQQTASNK